MYSEKLKKLVEAKTELKFRIKSPEQSKELQDFFFTMDVCWISRDKKVKKTDDPFIYLTNYDDPFIYLTNYDDPFIYLTNYEECNYIHTHYTTDYFSSHSAKEFDLENDCLVEECKWPNLKKLVEAKTELKFRINSPEQSKELQEFLFKNDVYWRDPIQDPLCLDAKFLFIGFKPNDLYSTAYRITKEDSDEEYFENNYYREFDLENDCIIEECKWPNLKKLVEKKTWLNFRIKNTEQSEEIQRFLFDLGIKWNNGQSHLAHTDAKFLNLWDEDNYTITYSNDIDTMSKEYDLENDCIRENKFLDGNDVIMMESKMPTLVKIEHLLSIVSDYITVLKKEIK